MECVRCAASDDFRLDRNAKADAGPSVRLYKCPMCFKPICERCAVRSYGREFCGSTCANQFFFGDDEE